ncbi:Cytochrome P450 52A13 [Colletotrichum gloeosporioides]|uniref:Cytochrome P450 52A13 n=1 Tax=Colletotrichum gloeosporioides TaxID=474922 RepID=A0A8H4CV43_COLGL|nr:Cytochrome P450 52A13 [Colletotrichum gloeosporioides]KAF3810626.1 Cytochrome P450 52A13 [Colletotrichum gloeosporioides]
MFDVSRTFMHLLKCFVVTFIIAIVTRTYYQNKKCKLEEQALIAQHGCQPVLATLPYKWPFAIDLLKLQYDALPEGRLLEFQTKYLEIAPTLRFDILGTGFVTTDPANIEAITNSRSEDFILGSRRKGLYPLLGEGIFTQDGLAWKHSREILRRQFARVREGRLGALEPHATELTRAIAMEAKENPVGIVDLQPHCFEYTLGTTTDLLFGESHSSLPQTSRQSLRDDFDYAVMVSALRLRLCDFAWLYNPKRFREACRGIREWASYFADKAINYIEDNGEDSTKNKYAFIGDLWRSLKDRTLVRDQLLHVLIAGRDTTACLMSWTFKSFHLVRNPPLLDRLKEEINTVFQSDDQEITRNDIQKLPFLSCCLKESMALTCFLPVNQRYAARDTVLPRGGGPDGTSPILLRKGNGVGWSAYHLHRRETLYGPDAKEYLPDRWASGELIRKVGLGSGFLDFHAGPRVCLGSKLFHSQVGFSYMPTTMLIGVFVEDYALMEASYGIIRVLQKYPSMKLPPGIPNLPVGGEKQNMTLVLSSADGVKVLLA